MERLAIFSGHTACPMFTHAYAAWGFSTVICQKGYLMMPGVLNPTPSSKSSTRPARCDLTKLLYLSATFSPLALHKGIVRL